MRSNDPIADYDRYDAEQEKRLENLPVCEYCNEPIQQETAIYYSDVWCCKECEGLLWLDIRSDFLTEVEE